MYLYNLVNDHVNTNNNGGNIYIDGGPKKDRYYNTILSEEQEKEYEKWVNTLPLNLRSDYDYDLRGAWLSGLKVDQYQHMPDTYKKPWHPTFSDESVYSTEKAPGGRWYDEKFIPSRINYSIYNAPFYQYGSYPYAKFKDGGKIHIKKENRGKFTEAANRAGKSVQAYASQILANKEHYSPTLVKRANFARNASKWHAEGGYVDSPDDPPFNYNPQNVNSISTLYSQYNKPSVVRPVSTVPVTWQPRDYAAEVEVETNNRSNSVLDGTKTVQTNSPSAEQIEEERRLKLVYDALAQSRGYANAEEERRVIQSRNDAIAQQGEIKPDTKGVDREAANWGYAMGAGHPMNVEEVNNWNLKNAELAGWIAAPNVMSAITAPYYTVTGRPGMAALTALPMIGAIKSNINPIAIIGEKLKVGPKTYTKNTSNSSRLFNTKTSNGDFINNSESIMNKYASDPEFMNDLNDIFLEARTLAKSNPNGKTFIDGWNKILNSNYSWSKNELIKAMRKDLVDATHTPNFSVVIDRNHPKFEKMNFNKENLISQGLSEKWNRLDQLLSKSKLSRFINRNKIDRIKSEISELNSQINDYKNLPETINAEKVADKIRQVKQLVNEAFGFMENDVYPRMKYNSENFYLKDPELGKIVFDFGYVDPRTAGSYNFFTDKIKVGIDSNLKSVLEKNSNYAYGELMTYIHELEHLMTRRLSGVNDTSLKAFLLNSNISNESALNNSFYTPKEAEYLNQAYNFTDEYLKNHKIFALLEKAATNRQLRAKLAKTYNLDFQSKNLYNDVNKMLENLENTHEGRMEILDVLSKENAYGESFVKYIEDNNLDRDQAASKIIKALKHVKTTVPFAIGYNTIKSNRKKTN